MKPNNYIDFTAHNIAEDNSVSVIMGQSYRMLHGVFGGSPGKYAIAFPGATIGIKKRTAGGVIRVFASSTADLKYLLEKINHQHIIRDYIRVGQIQQVPENFNGKWQTWRRVQIQKKEGIQREKSMLCALQSPFLDFRSSGGGAFALRVIFNDSSKQVEEAVPNSYGLASRGNLKGVGANLFSIPVL